MDVGNIQGLETKGCQGMTMLFIVQKVCYLLIHVQLFATTCTVAHQAPLSMEFSRKEYWSELPFPSPGNLLDPETEPGSPALQKSLLQFFTVWDTREAYCTEVLDKSPLLAPKFSHH